MPRNSARSIRLRLLLLLLVPVAIVLALGTTFDLHAFDKPVQQAYDRALSDAALALALNVRVDHQGHIRPQISQEARNLLATDSVDEVLFRIDTAEGQNLAGEATLPIATQDAHNPSIATLRWRDRDLRVASYRSATRAGTLTVTVAETLGKRKQLESNLLHTALWSDLLVLAAILASVWMGIRLALRPLDSLAGEVGKRSAEDLSPIAANDVPAEVQGLVLRLNELLATVQAGSKAERQFLESAAHQLRTPLTGVLAQLELLVDSERDSSRRPQLQATLAAARALAHTTQQLLSLAKAEYRAHSIADAAQLDLSDVAVLCLSAAAGKSATAGVELAADLGTAPVKGVEWLLIEAITNLIDNAITYTPAGGSVTVRTGSDGGCSFIEIVDTGTGIPPAERPRVVSRFYRGSTARGTGSGLGLAIVADVAARHDATLTISDGDAGLGTRIRLSFAVATSA